MNLSDITHLVPPAHIQPPYSTEARQRMESLLTMAVAIEDDIPGIVFTQITGTLFGPRSKVDGKLNITGCAIGKVLFVLGVRDPNEIPRKLRGITPEDVSDVIHWNDQARLSFSKIASRLREKARMVPDYY